MTGSSGGACTATACASWHHLTAKGPFQLKSCGVLFVYIPPYKCNPAPELCGAAIPSEGKTGCVGKSTKNARCRTEGTEFESHSMSREMKAMDTKCTGAGEQSPSQSLLFLYDYIYRKHTYTKNPLFCSLGSPLWGCTTVHATELGNQCCPGIEINL